MSKPFSDTSQKPTFQLKGTMLAITVFELAHLNIERLTKELTDKVKEAPEFFGTIPMVLGIDKLDIPLTKVELKGIITLFKEFHIQLMAIRTDNEKTITIAHTLGIVVLPPTGAREKLIEIAVNRPAPIEETNIPTLTKETQVEQTTPEETQQPLLIEETTSSQSASVNTEENQKNTVSSLDETHIDIQTNPISEDDVIEETSITSKVKHQLSSAMIVSTPIRSGQQIIAHDKDLIVTSTVSTGAELMADGNIHIYGTMRGRVMAGFRGNSKARVFCSKLTAELVSIAGQMITEEDLRRHPLWGKPAQLSLEENQLIITSLV